MAESHIALQELLAPSSVQFWSRDGIFIGTKGTLLRFICYITGVDARALCGYPLFAFGEEARFSWAKNRRTKRPEDEAYSLLGIFGVRMRPDYGEGRALAFERLSRKISKLHAAQSEHGIAQGTSHIIDRERMPQFFGRTARMKCGFSRPVLIDLQDFNVEKATLQPTASLNGRTGTLGYWTEFFSAKAAIEDSLDHCREVVYYHMRDPSKLHIDSSQTTKPRTRNALKRIFSPESSIDQNVSLRPVAIFDFVIERGSAIEELRRRGLLDNRTQSSIQHDEDPPNVKIDRQPSANSRRSTTGGAAIDISLHEPYVADLVRERFSREDASRALTLHNNNYNSVSLLQWLTCESSGALTIFVGPELPYRTRP